MVTAVRMYRSWSWFNATLLNKHFMHGSVTTQLNIYSFAHQATSVAVNKYSISTDTGSMQHWLFFHWSIYCQISDALCWCVAKIEVGMILTASQRRRYCKTGTCHAVVWKVEQRPWNKVSNKLVFGDFLPFFRNILAERTFDMCPFLPSLPHICVYAHTGWKYFWPFFPFFHGLLNRWEGLTYILIQVLGQSIVLLCVLCPWSCSSWVVYNNICLSCFIFTWGQRNMRLLLGHWKSSF